MPRLLVALIAVGLGAAAVIAQGQPLTMVRIASDRVDGFKAGVEPQPEPYQNGPWAAIPAEPANDSARPSVRAFRLKAWKEVTATRVVVFAVSPDPTPSEPNREREIQVSTFLLAPGEVRRVTTDQFGAKPVVVSYSGQDLR